MNKSRRAHKSCHAPCPRRFSYFRASSTRFWSSSISPSRSRKFHRRLSPPRLSTRTRDGHRNAGRARHPTHGRSPPGGQHPRLLLNLLHHRLLLLLHQLLLALDEPRRVPEVEQLEEPRQERPVVEHLCELRDLSDGLHELEVRLPLHALVPDGRARHGGDVVGSLEGILRDVRPPHPVLVAVADGSRELEPNL